VASRLLPQVRSKLWVYAPNLSLPPNSTPDSSLGFLVFGLAFFYRQFLISVLVLVFDFGFGFGFGFGFDFNFNFNFDFDFNFDFNFNFGFNFGFDF